MANSGKLAKVSKTPGRTQLINLFQIDNTKGTIVDLPGYGYAAVNKKISRSWKDMIETYLLERKNLVMIIVLVDGLVGPTKLDIQMLDWLTESNLSHSIVATKKDKVKPSRLQSRVKDLAEKSGVEQDQVIWISAQKGDSLDLIRNKVALWVK